MMLPLYPNEFFGRSTGMVVGTLTGIGFGFALERSGFGRAPILAAQFYGTNMRVFKVMFTAIATAATGLAILAGLGWLDLGQLTIPETYWWPQLTGGLLLGVGFIIAGYCPGTACVAAASGDIGGMLTYLGVMLGSLVFGFTYPVFADLYLSGKAGVLRLDTLFGLPYSVVAAAVVALAVGCFFGAEAIERWFSKRNQQVAPDALMRPRNRSFAVLAVLALAALATLALPQTVQSAVARKAGTIKVLPLVDTALRQPEKLWLVDVREQKLCKDRTLPAAVCLSDVTKGAAAAMPSHQQLVLIGGDTIKEVPTQLAEFAGEVVSLQGGYPAYAAELLADLPAEATQSMSPARLAEYRLRGALHARLTGAQAPVAAPAAVVPTAAPASAAKKGGGC